MPIRFFVVCRQSVRGPIAQLVEHRADNAGVSGAIPLRPSFIPLTASFFE